MFKNFIFSFFIPHNEFETIIILIDIALVIYASNYIDRTELSNFQYYMYLLIGYIYIYMALLCSFVIVAGFFFGTK